MRSNIRFLLMACLAVGLGSGCGDTSETKAADAATSDAAKVGDTQGDVPVGSDAVDAITDNGAQDTPDGAVVSDVPVVLDAAADAAADATATDAPVAVDGGGRRLDDRRWRAQEYRLCRYTYRQLAHC